MALLGLLRGRCGGEGFLRRVGEVAGAPWRRDRASWRLCVALSGSIFVFRWRRRFSRFAYRLEGTRWWV